MALAQRAETPDPSYARVLRTLGLDPRVEWPWASVGRATRSGGWKLHLSSIPIEAQDLLRRVAPLLVRRRVPFKVAADERALIALDNAMFGASQIGKFVTIYPRSDDEARDLASELLERTDGFGGPKIPSDRQLGGVVYTRYGGFDPVRRHDRLGQELRFVRHEGGELIEDRHSVPFAPPEGVTWPFGEIVSATPAEAKDARAGSLFGPGYLVLRVLREHPKGSVFLGLDLARRETVAAKVLKQGWRHCASDALGRDMRHRLRHQLTVRGALPAEFPAPAAGPYFEVGGNGYLAFDRVEGRTLEALAVERVGERGWGSLPTGERRLLIEVLAQLADAVSGLHREGFVHRDLTASNVMVRPDGSLALLDLELAHHRDDPAQPLALGTPGFMSPQQEQGLSPRPSDDIYSLGCVMVLLLSGFDPRRVLTVGAVGRPARLAALGRGAPPALLDLAHRSIDAVASRRPNLDAVRLGISRALDEASSRARVRIPRPLGESVEERLDAALVGLLEDTVRDAETALWLSPKLDLGGHQAPLLAAESSYELRRSAHRGVAGPLYVLARAARFRGTPPAAPKLARKAIDFLLSEGDGGAARLPGLHFGEAGVAVALAEASAVGWVAPAAVETAIADRLSGRLDWPDLTHGAAGQGVACWCCADALERPAWRRLGGRCAEYLIGEQDDDGSWAAPAGVEGLSGRRPTGFAHGTAGIVYFLIDWARTSGDAAAEAAWRRGIGWLEAMAQPAGRGDGSLTWPYSDHDGQPWHWWCHGAPGIALTFLRAFESTGERRFAALARRALRSLPPRRRAPNLSLCHGLAGLGEIYLEAHRVLGERRWLLRADEILGTLGALARRGPTGGLTWAVQDPRQPTADLMIGSAGIAHLLLRRWSAGREAVGFPLLGGPYRDSEASVAGGRP